MPATLRGKRQRDSVSRPDSRPNDRKKRNRRPHRGPRPLRVGCVNVQGLPHHKWTAVLDLIDRDVFDYLFLLETWYVDHAARRGDPRVIAATEPPSAPPPTGHHPGGIILLGTPRSRGWLRGPPVVCGQEAITVVASHGRLTGVYLPPRLDPEYVEEMLDSIADSDVILGDVNTRFDRLAAVQYGAPGPPSRLKVFRRWMETNSLIHVMPTGDDASVAGSPCEAMLNLDHCFVRDHLRSRALHLPGTRGLGLVSDHRYALSLTLNGAAEEAKERLRLPRYRIRLLDDESRVDAVRRAWTRRSGHRPDLLRLTSDVDRRNAQIVALCQQVSEAALGKRPDKRRTRSTGKDTNKGLYTSPEDEGGVIGSIRLYKRAARTSRENGVLLPTETGRVKGISAIEEVAAGLAERFSARGSDSFTPKASDSITSDLVGAGPDYVSAEDILEELQHQDPSKACGMDGVHIRLMKTLSSTSFVHVLVAFYNSCIKYARTPRVWNDTMVCLIVKDNARPKDADNVRPITLIGMFRKVFERLLLRRFDAAGWAKVQPTQAGFRSHYSTCVNAAVLHALLESRQITHVAFLDFKAAFDVVDHSLLLDILRRRGCPPWMQRLIVSLTFDHIRSRIVSDGEASDWFSRDKGVLQGSPLSPYLFNIFVDGLLEELNDGATAVPRSLFYADDGTLLASSSSEIQRLLRAVADWSARHRMTLNVKKCGYIAPPEDQDPVYLGDEKLPRLEEYSYLGFPVTGAGIDFDKHLTKRLDQACGRANFLSLHSDRWGPAHRLRVYRQYLAPMFEYGAPLMAAHAEDRSKIWESTQDAVKGLTGWIAGYSSNTHLTRNLLGLQPLPDRFADLKTTFQVIIRHTPTENPLKALRGLDVRSGSFYRCLTNDQTFHQFLDSRPDIPAEQHKIKKSIRSFLRERQDLALAREARRRKLTRLIPSASRLKCDMRGADSTFCAPRIYQKQFLQYRRGTYHSCQKCVCAVAPAFRRGHEACCRATGTSWLTGKEHKAKARIQAALGSKLQLTDIDFLLNTGKFDRAHAIMQHITKTLAGANSTTTS